MAAGRVTGGEGAGTGSGAGLGPLLWQTADRTGIVHGLHRIVQGEGRRLVLAHGFTQNARCWGRFGHDLARDHTVVAVDLPGHGHTPPALDRVDLVEAGRLLAVAGGPAAILGYSMGGRTALHAALSAPDSVRALVLIGATAGLDDPDERAVRRRADEDLARRLETVGIEAFLEGWLANPLFAGLSDEAASRAERLTNRVEGLAASLRHCGTGTQKPLWGRLGQLSMPVLAIAGADDAKFAALGQRLVDAVPDGTLRLLPGTHAVHLEQPDATAEAVRSWLADRLGPA